MSESTPLLSPEKRRLAAIMVADIAGFSSLMEKDESGTFDRVRTLREQFIAPRVAEHGGRIIKTTGDGFLAEFPSATSALRCGVEIQRSNLAQEALRPVAERIRMRIGLNVGDIIVDGDDIAGDGVIIAARLEPLAPPDGICISGTVREHIRQDLGIEYLDLGDQHVKNISRPIRAYRIDLAATAGGESFHGAGPVIGAKAPNAQPSERYLSVVVLPFANRTGDSAQEYLADGLTESLTMDLSRIRDAFIVNAPTAFAYKNKPMVTQQVGRDLGVRFVLQGSVQRSGTRIRISAHLADTESNGQLWSETFEGDQSDLFALQDQVTARIANSIGREIVTIAGREAERKSSPTVADLMLRVRALTVRDLVALNDLQQIESLCREVLALELNHAGAMGYLATALMLQANNSAYDGDTDARKEKFTEGREIAARAKELDPKNPNVYMAFAMYARANDDYAGYRRAVETSVSLNPKFPGGYANLAYALLGCGEPQRAIEALNQAIGLDPKRPSAVILANMSWAYFMLGDNDAAIEWALRFSEMNPASPQPYAVLAIAHALKDDDAKARAAANDLRRVGPALLLKAFAPYPSQPDAYKRYFEERLTPAWRKAGLPE